MKEHVFNMKDPIIVGMEVIEGTLRVGTPLCIPAMGGMEIGRVTSIEQVSASRTECGKVTLLFHCASSLYGNQSAFLVCISIQVIRLLATT